MINWNENNWEYEATERIGRQTVKLYLQLQDCEPEDDTLYFNVYLTLYSKRKHICNNEDAEKITGKDALKTFVVVRRMFNDIVYQCLEDFLFSYNIVIYCHWLDNRRRDAYYKFLKTLDFKYGTVENTKVILRRWERIR